MPTNQQENITKIMSDIDADLSVLLERDNHEELEDNRESWEELKLEGSEHSKRLYADIQPIDLYRSAGAFRAWALIEICQHALRNLDAEEPILIRDMEKIIDYARKLKAYAAS